MLRALGVLFIIGCCFFAGVLGIGVTILVARATILSPAASESSVASSSRLAVPARERDIMLISHEEAGRNDSVRNLPPTLIAQAQGVPVATSVVLSATKPALKETTLTTVRVSASGSTGPIAWPLASQGRGQVVTLPHGTSEFVVRVRVLAADWNPENSARPEVDVYSKEHASVAWVPSERMLEITYSNVPLGQFRAGIFYADGNDLSTNDLRVIVQPAAPPSPPPEYLNVFNSPYDSSGASRPQNPNSPFLVYRTPSNDHYLKITYQSAVSESLHHFYLVETDSTGTAIKGTVVTPNLRGTLSGGGYFATFKSLPLQVGSTAALYLRTDAGSSQITSAPLYLRLNQSQANSQLGQRLTLADPWKERAGIWYSSPKSLVVQAAVTLQGQGDLDLVLLDAGNSAALAATRGLSASTQVTLTELSPGPRRIRMALFQGSHEIATSEAVAINVLDSGPKVDHVDARAFSTSASENKVILYFDPDHPLDAALAADKQSYTVSSNTPGVAVATASWSAKFDSENNSVELSLLSPVAPGNYQITVNAFPKGGNESAKGIRGITGIPLNAASHDGTGTAYSVSVRKPTDAEIPTVEAGVRDTRAPYIAYPEFTSPRKVLNGFNPSDKVVTRVVRLYYFRDAHRVTQIINRTARSYNRQAVEMKQQVADHARNVADIAEDDRLRLEREAVRAAQQARGTEVALREQQQALIAARQQTGVVADQLQREKSELANKTAQRDSAQRLRDAANQELTDALAQHSAAQAGMDQAAKDAAQSRVDNARLVLATATTNLQAAEGARSKVAAVHDALLSRHTAAEEQVRQLESTIQNLLGEVQALRSKEIEYTEQWEGAERKEQRTREEQFRREVAAKTEDPDTYAPGVPTSDDPVEQCSLSVIGEGLIQIRGPIKGVNIVHTMINQIDAPVGQVRVTVHTLQINGEHGDRMETAAMRIQRYLDHSRFLTVQSSEMLRKAVVQVAARKAESAWSECPPSCGQELRDLKYCEAFFGKDFIDELREMDSEFLKSGNKVLSLHSMDTTSLSSALFLMALAKNDTRQEILSEFMFMIENQLPEDERAYFKASRAEKWYRHDRFQFLAKDARFVSLRGFFDTQILDPDTLSPMQREFIRLAQIFKARLVTEIELRQRVMERALIEERIRNYAAELQMAKAKEDAATLVVAMAQQNRRFAQQVLAERFADLTAKVQMILPTPVLPIPLGAEIEEAYEASGLKFWRDAKQQISPTEAIELGSSFRDNLGNIVVSIGSRTMRLHVTFMGVVGEEADLSKWQIVFDGPDKAGDEAFWRQAFANNVSDNHKMIDYIRNFELDVDDRIVFESELRYMRYVDAASGSEPAAVLRHILIMSKMNSALPRIIQHIQQRIDVLLGRAVAIGSALTDRGADVRKLRGDWKNLEGAVYASISSPSVEAGFRRILEGVDEAFQKILIADGNVAVALDDAEAARLPLDHKKFLDMLVDDVEQKFIELVDGTRAQTANIDNYIGRLTTALEDDFNTQFYQPAFRYIRETNYSYDVQLGQIQTESILTNNRMFGKVSPQATMEFDLPKRDILINEAFQSALAAYNDYGALLSDPNFMALARMYGGQPASATYLSGSPAPQVRSVLPGLPSQTDAKYLSQAENNVPAIGSNLEALIPDPAIYKFETGTGFEVRPVIQPDGQAVVFRLQYLYTTNVREPVRADEKHLGRVKQHYIDTDVVTANYELREVSRFQVGLKASRTSRGVPLLEDVPVAGVLFRPLPSDESALQQNLIYAQSVIYPTLFDLMGLRWAPAVADLDSLSLMEREFVTRNRERYLRNEVFDYSSLQVDDFMRIPPAERRGDLYRTQEEIPYQHPNGYTGSGLNLQTSPLQEGYSPYQMLPAGELLPGTGFGFPGPDAAEVETLPPAPPGKSATSPIKKVLPPGGPALPNPPGPAALQSPIYRGASWDSRSAAGVIQQQSGTLPAWKTPATASSGTLPPRPLVVPQSSARLQGRISPTQGAATADSTSAPAVTAPMDVGSRLRTNSPAATPTTPRVRQTWFERLIPSRDNHRPH